MHSEENSRENGWQRKNWTESNYNEEDRDYNLEETEKRKDWMYNHSACIPSKSTPIMYADARNVSLLITILFVSAIFSFSSSLWVISSNNLKLWEVSDLQEYLLHIAFLIQHMIRILRPIRRVHPKEMIWATTRSVSGVVAFELISYTILSLNLTQVSILLAQVN